MRAFTAVALIAVTTMMLPARIEAQQSDDWNQCFGIAREGVSAEQKLVSCTAVIESGGRTAQGLSAAFINRGGIYLTNRSYDRAIDDYNEAIRLNPKSASVFNARGLAYLRKGRIDRAIEDFDEAIRLNPTLALALVNRASAYQEKAQWDFDAYLAVGVYEDRAIQDLDEAIRLNPNNATAFRNRGFVNSRRQRYDRAIQDFDEAIRLNANVAAAFSGRAYALRFVGQYERAIADYRQALTLQLDDTSRRQIERVLKQLGAATDRDATPTAVTKR
jgi:tetratricopeptide (TPR) repeat protein